MLKSGPFRSVLSFTNQAIDYFESRVQQHKTLLETIRSALPDNLSKHVLHALLNGKKLLIYTDSAIWATQLRFHEKSLLACITSASINKDAIVQIKLAIESVGPSLTNQEGTTYIPTSDKLEALRSYCISSPDNELTAALLRLTETLEQKRSGSNKARNG